MIQHQLDAPKKEEAMMGVTNVDLVLHQPWVHNTLVFPDERQRI